MRSCELYIVSQSFSRGFYLEQIVNQFRCPFIAARLLNLDVFIWQQFQLSGTELARPCHKDEVKSEIDESVKMKMKN